MFQVAFMFMDVQASIVADILVNYGGQEDKA